MARYDEWYKIGWTWNNGRVEKRTEEIGAEKKSDVLYDSGFHFALGALRLGGTWQFCLWKA